MTTALPRAANFLDILCRDHTVETINFSQVLSMAAESDHGHALPAWFASPGDGDVLAWLSLALIIGALYALVTLYAAFDRWAEHQSHGTPLAKTIPTMLTVALLYEIFPLGHFNILLPISAILIALMADWARFNLRGATAAETDPRPDVENQTSEADRV
ncbi:hypothetical protein [uncultured Roseovarius sp.]|uniref:hypothetical protein n=1 Tax=uncultured Roseovarius sp. TaxID=293344 RepID=UPI002605A562|nr:hypothetical protein [uncultured Roseovarius sp.]